MVKQHLGILFIMLIYTNLGLFAVLADLLRFLLKAHVFTCNWFKIVLYIWLYCKNPQPFGLYILFTVSSQVSIINPFKLAYYCKLLVLVSRLSLFTHQNGWRLPCEVKPCKTITIII